MPLAVQAHHAVVDGQDVGRYFEHIQVLMDNPAGLTGSAVVKSTLILAFFDKNIIFSLPGVYPFRFGKDCFSFKNIPILLF